MNSKVIIYLVFLSFSLPSFSMGPALFVKLFEKSFQHSVSAIFPYLTLRVNLHKNPDYMGGAFPTYNTYEISIGENTIRRLGEDATGLILCHELGHLLAGKPFKSTTSWMTPYMSSTEARSDYYAANVCVKYFLDSNPEIIQPDLSDAPKILTQRCEYQYPNKVRKQLCERAGMAAYTLVADIWNYLGLSEAALPSFYAKARPLRYNESAGQYPTLQCRLDTFLAGIVNDPQPNCF